VRRSSRTGRSIYSLQLLVHLAVGPALSGWPLPLRIAALAGVVTALMTWLVMARLARALEAWLYAPRRRAHPPA
jgi:antibiotic biosynthesis monooxygenase (ABM) superfamily enzyme